MKIVKNKKEFNSFSIENLTLGHLMVIERALDKAKKDGTLGAVGEDVWTLLVTRKDS